MKMSLCPTGLVSSAATPIIAAIAACIASVAIWHQISINRRNKRIDIIAGCNGRYDTLYDLRIKLIDETKPRRDVKSYYGRYWGLKSDQFDYWLAGFVDIDTFTDWCFLTIKAFADNPVLQCREKEGGQIESLTFDWGWFEVGLGDHQVTNPWFTELIWALRELGVAWEAESRLDPNDGSKSELASTKADARRGLFEILRIVLEKSSTYRAGLQYDMTLQQYERSAKEFRILGLTRTNRTLSLNDLDKHWLYWWVRRKWLVGVGFARVFPAHSAELSPYPATLQSPRPARVLVARGEEGSRSTDRTSKRLRRLSADNKQ